MDDEQAPPEEPSTAPDELLPDASIEERTRDAALHSAKEAERERESDDGEQRP